MHTGFDSSVPRQRVAVLGSTGSIGLSTLEVLAAHPDRFEIVGLSAHTRSDLLFSQCLQVRPRWAALTGAHDGGRDLQRRLRDAGLPTKVLAGPNGLVELASHGDVDTVMAAIVGAAGLASSLAAAQAGKRLLLANKEALVVGGALFMRTVADHGCTLLPIDSEHSAVFQCLPSDRSSWQRTVRRIILTASGGPFRTREPGTLSAVTPQEACAHPNWVMGRKISVDSATMMNKALEVIEAHYLFGLAAHRIEVLIHPQSVIHSMVHMVDGSVMAQLGTPDMKVPIAYGLGWPERITSCAAPLDFGRIGALTFETLDSAGHRTRFPLLQMAWQCLDAGEGWPVVLNAANELAVQAFLDGQARFDQIHACVDAVVQGARFEVPQSLGAIQELDEQARAAAKAWLLRHTAWVTEVTSL